ncbi:MAG: DUF3152 domain-containing protein [Candidatus Saccharibacteria bacterium]
MTIYSLAALFSVFVVANIVLFALYQNKTLPHYTLAGVSVGGKSYDAIAQMSSSNFLPPNVTLEKNSASQVVSTSSLGIAVDWGKSVANLKKSKPIVPLLAFIGKHDVSVVLATNQHMLTDKLTSLQTMFSRPATDRRITFLSGNFVIQDAQAGYALDIDSSTTVVARAVAQGQTHITVATTALPAGNNTGDLNGQLAALQKQIKTTVTFNYQGKKVTPTAADMAGWYVQDGQTMSLSDTAISNYIDATAHQFGITAANRSDLITAVTYVLNKNLPSNFTVVSTVGSVVRTYCTAVNGVSQDELPDLIGKLAATYSDTRGWNDNGTVAFRHVASGCTYNVVIAAPNLMTSYGAICDNYYNCQVGNSVIVNNDRWLYATDPWSKTGQSLETYRLLIINHETGHRLGFYDNPTCPGPGQPAPVMMQQSIDLKGCVFNTWPLQSELDALKTML